MTPCDNGMSFHAYACGESMYRALSIACPITSLTGGVGGDRG
jgi:hypothetical protein